MDVNAIIADTYGVEGLLKVEKAEGIITFEPPTIHDLFNELHRRLVAESVEADLHKSLVLNNIYTKLDEMHHTYTDIQDPDWKIVSAGVRPYPE